MPASNPLTAIDLLIRDQILHLPFLAALWKNAGKVQAFDRKVDIRRNFEDAILAGSRALVVPRGMTISPNFSSGSMRFRLRYDIACYSGKMTIEDIRLLEWGVALACTRLYQGIGPDGSPLDANAAAPLVIETFNVGEVEEDRQRVDMPEEWESVTQLTVFADGDKAALAAL